MRQRLRRLDPRKPGTGGCGKFAVFLSHDGASDFSDGEKGKSGAESAFLQRKTQKEVESGQKYGILLM